MGRNNLETREVDKNWGKNITQNVPFKFELTSEQYCRKFELAQGLEMNKLTLTIILNARYKIQMDDTVDIKGVRYRVATTSDNYDNPNQGKYKGSMDAFTGYCVVGLE